MNQFIESEREVSLCYCSNCDTFLINENPDGDIKHDIKSFKPDTIKKMKFIYDSDDDEDKVMFNGTGYWVCPICGTDEFIDDN
jgi:hypothetical protein